VLSEADIEAAASRLDEAEKSRKQIGLLSLAHPDIDMEGAYAIQAAWMRKKVAAGRRIKGWKIGLTSKAMQSALKIDIPDSGVLLDDMIFQDGATVPPDRFIQPRIEAEIAFIMSSALSGKDVTIYDVLNATEYVTPAIEILDTRILRSDPESGKMRTVFDTIADNAANAGIVLGGRPLRPLDVDLRWVGAVVSRNAEVEETGLGAGVLNHPAQSVAWLIRRLANYGLAISSGDIVLSGSFIRPVEARHGDTIVADYGAYGTVSCHFA
jgi:2-oxo-hept-3-ene-1,7-dioate hydratase